MATPLPAKPPARSISRSVGVGNGVTRSGHRWLAQSNAPTLAKTSEVRIGRLRPPKATAENIAAGKKKNTMLPFGPPLGNQDTLADAIRASQRPVGKK